MSFRVTTEPLDSWPGAATPDHRRVWPTFTASYSDTMELLERELRALDARGAVVIQVVTRNGANDLRRDGLLRAQARIEHPGCRLSFESKHGPLTYATDRVRSSGARQGWQQNLRAIALSLEALRKVDRYGVAQSGEQYRGWRAIEATAAGPSPIDVIRKWAGWEVGPDPADARDVAKAIRWARVNAHPDKHGGDHGPHAAVAAAAKQLGVEL